MVQRRESAYGKPIYERETQLCARSFITFVRGQMCTDRLMTLMTTTISYIAGGRSKVSDDSLLSTGRCAHRELKTKQNEGGQGDDNGIPRSESYRVYGGLYGGSFAGGPLNKSPTLIYMHQDIPVREGIPREL